MIERFMTDRFRRAWRGARAMRRMRHYCTAHHGGDWPPDARWRAGRMIPLAVSLARKSGPLGRYLLIREIEQLAPFADRF